MLKSDPDASFPSSVVSVLYDFVPRILIPVVIFILPLIYYAGRFTTQLEVITSDVGRINTSLNTLKETVSGLDKVMAVVVSNQVKIDKLEDTIPRIQSELDQLKGEVRVKEQRR